MASFSASASSASLPSSQLGSNSFSSVCDSLGLQHLHCIVTSKDKRYLCEAVCENDTWKLLVTDAVEKCWRAVMDERVMEEKRKEMQFDSWETFFEVLRKAFHEGHLSVQADVTKFFLLVGQRNPRRFELQQEVDAKRCIQDCVFRLASKQHSQLITRLRHDLENCKRRLASSRSASASQSSPTHVDNSFARQLKRKPAGSKKKSENLVNPGRPIYKKSRKISFERKASSSEDDD